MTPVRPSEVTDWLRCPRYWQYKHVEGWQPPPSAWTPQQLMGTAIHAGLANYWRVKQGVASLKPEKILIQVKDPHMAMEMALKAGWPADAPMEYSYDAHEAQAGRVLNAALRWIEQEMADAAPVLVEEPLGADGHTTPDLVTREPFPGTHSENCYGSSIELGRRPGICDSTCGTGLVVTDWKYSHDVAPDRVKYRLEGPERVHQFWHYVWAVGEALGEPVALFRKVVIIGGPKVMVKDATFRPTAEGLAQWLGGAKLTWQTMEDMRWGYGPYSTYQNPNGCKPYGDKWPCPMWDACWTCHGDRTKMAQFYTRNSS